ncbi:magnesium transporter [Mesorhizobium sp. M7A.F.Ca.CA.001.09.2.1]|uniref:Magnesium transporter MgtE n=6 Tax=Mesorhizobium TaxID=68287 RepID=A0AB38T5V4_9HYPH|nr:MULTISPECIES: magnesium transporter [Mesorhizobium]RUY40279.1 magnesium transporter [Mesorhizobium sp. M7A.F.Ca.CA.001.13.2.1]MDF3216196.1 magnesium transporter [Mesorhizobium ciceri]RUY64729.1 magnesium transporter [Mesorhizobium sp. M7A.F.Ca.CA.001.13.1.1]RUY72383.1 magnesium transporter [Mesorhizobium sp. M7A.F.Ca.CA.001.05.1.1]RUY80198.1 magnesium transporter [Mesorhizobium sp. M7A.F.Ca.CA.001.09.2.1]
MNEFTTVASDEAVAIARILANDHVADIVEALNREPRETATELLCEVTFERLVEIFDQPELDGAPELMEALPRAKAGKLLTAMSVDRAADILRELDEPARSELLGGLAPPLRATLLSILGYPEGSAASIMTTEFVSVPSDWSVGQTLDYIRKVERTRETVYAIYIVDPQTHLLVRSTGLRRLITGEPDDSIMTVAPDHLPVTVGPLTDRETLAQTISKYDLLAVPVVDHGKILGIVTIDDIIDTMIAETTEDVHRFGGMEALDEPYMKMSFLAMIRKRGGWLCALFISEMLTANAMQSYEGELEKAIVLTLFIPLIMSSGGNSGSQATSLVIRALALREIGLGDWWRVALRELPTGLVLGAMLGVVGVCRIALWQYMGFYDYGPHWPLIATTVGAALVGIVTFGSLSGSMLPFALKRIGFDPASASAPFVATLVDVTGLVIYFSVALVILRGTLL